MGRLLERRREGLIIVGWDVSNIQKKMVKVMDRMIVSVKGHNKTIDRSFNNLKTQTPTNNRNLNSSFPPSKISTTFLTISVLNNKWFHQTTTVKHNRIMKICHKMIRIILRRLWGCFLLKIWIGLCRRGNIFWKGI